MVAQHRLWCLALPRREPCERQFCCWLVLHGTNSDLSARARASAYSEGTKGPVVPVLPWPSVSRCLLLFNVPWRGWY